TRQSQVAMPRLSVRFVRLALVYFVLGTAVGALLLVQKAWTIHPALWYLRPVHAEVLLVGFMIQLAFGVAHWILPRPPAPQPEAPVLAVLAALNAGIWLVGAGELLQVGVLVPAGRLAELVAAVTFGVHILP